MLIIRKHQMEALRAARRQQFLDRLVGDLTGRSSLRDPATIRAEVAAALEQAAAFQISSERDLRRFVEIMLLRMGGIRSVYPPKSCLNILHRTWTPAGDRLDLLEKWIDENGVRASSVHA